MKTTPQEQTPSTMNTQASRVIHQQIGRETKSYRVGLDVQTLNRLIRLEEATQITGQVWIQSATLALLAAFERTGFLQLPLVVVPRATVPDLGRSI